MRVFLFVFRNSFLLVFASWTCGTSFFPSAKTPAPFLCRRGVIIVSIFSFFVGSPSSSSSLVNRCQLLCWT